MKKEVAEVAEKFNIQYVRLILTSTDYANDPILQERMKKGATYFGSILYDIVLLANNTQVETANDTLRTRASDLATNLRELLKQKCELLMYVKENGFSLLPYLHQRAIVLTGQENTKKKKTVPKKTEKKDITATNAPCNIKLLNALKAWRKAKAEEMNVPAYCILRQESLNDIAATMPHDAATLLKCRYMGNAKLKNFGDELLDIVNDYAQ